MRKQPVGHRCDSAGTMSELAAGAGAPRSRASASLRRSLAATCGHGLERRSRRSPDVLAVDSPCSSAVDDRLHGAETEGRRHRDDAQATSPPAVARAVPAKNVRTCVTRSPWSSSAGSSRPRPPRPPPDVRNETFIDRRRWRNTRSVVPRRRPPASKFGGSGASGLPVRSRVELPSRSSGSSRMSSPRSTRCARHRRAARRLCCTSRPPAPRLFRHADVHAAQGPLVAEQLHHGEHDHASAQRLAQAHRTSLARAAAPRKSTCRRRRGSACHPATGRRTDQRSRKIVEGCRTSSMAEKLERRVITRPPAYRGASSASTSGKTPASADRTEARATGRASFCAASGAPSRRHHHSFRRGQMRRQARRLLSLGLAPTTAPSLRACVRAAGCVGVISLSSPLSGRLRSPAFANRARSRELDPLGRYWASIPQADPGRCPPCRSTGQGDVLDARPVQHLPGQTEPGRHRHGLLALKLVPRVRRVGEVEAARLIAPDRLEEAGQGLHLPWRRNRAGSGS